MERKEFIRMVGAATAFSILMPCLSSCESEQEEPAPSNTNPGGSNQGGGNQDVLFTLDLNDPDISQKFDQDRYVYEGEVIVALTRNDEYIALSRACTHRGTTVVFQPQDDRFFCPNHGSLFGLEGQVQKSPAEQPLTMYQTELDAANNQLRVLA